MSERYTYCLVTVENSASLTWYTSKQYRPVTENPREGVSVKAWAGYSFDGSSVSPDGFSFPFSQNGHGPCRTCAKHVTMKDDTETV